jgi:lysophospholipase L1-like esterase
MADKPVTREEKYLAYLTGDYKGELPKPITRKEKYLYELCLKGIGGEISPEEIKNAVNEYLEKNPVKPGATTEQAQQIEQNKTNIASLKEDLGNLVNGTQEVITIPDMIGSVAEYTGYEHKIAEVKTGEKWIVLFNTFSSAVSIRNMSNVSDSWNGVSSKMDTKNMCELQIPVDGSLRLNVEDASYSGTYYAYNVTNKAILSDYLEGNGINGLYKIYTGKNEEYIKQYADSIDPLTDSNLFSTKNIASDGTLDFRGYRDDLMSYTVNVNIGTDYIFVAELEVENKSGFDIDLVYLSEGLVIRNSDGVVIVYAPVLDSNGNYTTGNSANFGNLNFKNNTKKTFKILGRIDTKDFNTDKIYWALGFNRFREKNSDVNITTGISGICKNVWIFADNQDSDEKILNLVGKNFLDKNIFVEHCISSDTASKIDSIFSGKKLTTYGDSITENGGWQSYLKDYFGFTIENKGIGGTTVSDNGNENSFCKQNRIDTISSDSDVVIIMGGTNDCGQSIEIGDLTYSDGFDTTKFKGGLATTIRMVQNRCPNALIFVASLCGGRGNTAGENLDTPVYNSKNLTSYDYAKATKDVAEFFNIQYIPIFEECGINCWNRATYIADTVHPNDFGKKQLAKIFIKYLASYLIN